MGINNVYDRKPFLVLIDYGIKICRRIEIELGIY